MEQTRADWLASHSVEMRVGLSAAYLVRRSADATAVHLAGRKAARLAATMADQMVVRWAEKLASRSAALMAIP
jgi:hypothetical protein